LVCASSGFFALPIHPGFAAFSHLRFDPRGRSAIDLVCTLISFGHLITGRRLGLHCEVSELARLHVDGVDPAFSSFGARFWALELRFLLWWDDRRCYLFGRERRQCAAYLPRTLPFASSQRTSLDGLSPLACDPPSNCFQFDFDSSPPTFAIQLFSHLINYAD
jgi:hypothetical protein